MKIRFLLIMVFVLVPALALSAEAPDMDGVRFLKTSPQDGSAVLKRADGKMEVVKTGDSLYPGAKIVEIGDAMVVIKEETDEGPETVIIRLEGGEQSVERIRRVSGKQPLLYSPAVETRKAIE